MKAKRGILLLEVVITATILAVGLTMILRSFTSSIRTMEAAQDYSTAIILAERVLWDLKMKKPDERESYGQFKDFPGFEWSQESLEDDELNRAKLNLYIKWKRRNRDYSFKVATYTYYDEETD